MMEIIEQTNPVLLSKAHPITEFDSELRSIVSELHDFATYGFKIHPLGLAAPQVGLPIRLFLFDPDFNRFETIINPEIIEISGSVISREGCLSVPGVQVDVKRASSVKLKWQTQYGKWLEELFTGLPAFIIQHEIDHLNGILISSKK